MSSLNELAILYEQLSHRIAGMCWAVREDAPVDPVYLALKQATGKYGGRRGSSVNNLDSTTPSPGNLSQVSLQDQKGEELKGEFSNGLATPRDTLS
ncbi:unnamed protein product [Haemonchus placei]|uniref:Bacteriocin immunity protein n=1 Tax=Haemonchus placei TaxID=6290 RepID=A0A0N4WUB9_HAEPC|nr:unnamed protein product [Haemonchus placei]